MGERSNEYQNLQQQQQEIKAKARKAANEEFAKRVRSITGQLHAIWDDDHMNYDLDFHNMELLRRCIDDCDLLARRLEEGYAKTHIRRPRHPEERDGTN